MEPLIKAFGRFIRRDVTYILGGGSVIISFFYCTGYFDRLLNLPDAFYLFMVGIAYVIGYAIQDGFSLTPFATTTSYFTPSPIVRWLYKQFVRQPWEDNKESFNPYERLVYFNQKEMDKQIPQSSLEFRERIIAFEMIGMTMGPCAGVSSIFLFIRAVVSSQQRCFNILLAIGILLLGILFLALGWIKATQQMEFSEKLFKSLIGKGGEHNHSHFAPVSQGTPTNDTESVSSGYSGDESPRAYLGAKFQIARFKDAVTIYLTKEPLSKKDVEDLGQWLIKSSKNEGGNNEQ